LCWGGVGGGGGGGGGGSGIRECSFLHSYNFLFENFLLVLDFVINSDKN